MALPTESTLSGVYDVWERASHMEAMVEASLAAKGGSFACDGFNMSLTPTGMHITKLVGNRGVHIEIDIDNVDATTGQVDREIHGKVVPATPVNPELLQNGTMSLVLTGESITRNLYQCAQLLNGSSAA